MAAVMTANPSDISRIVTKINIVAKPTQSTLINYVPVTQKVTYPITSPTSSFIPVSPNHVPVAQSMTPPIPTPSTSPLPQRSTIVIVPSGSILTQSLGNPTLNISDVNVPRLTMSLDDIHRTINTHTVDAWLTETPAAPAVKRRTRGVKQDINPIFQEYSEYTEDLYWKDIFRDAAKGTFPNKFSYNNGNLVFTRGNKTNVHEIDPASFEAAYACIEFFQQYGNLYSPIDIAERDAPVSEEFIWENLSKKTQEMLIDDHIDDLGKSLTLSESERIDLDQILRLAICMKIINKTHIQLNGKRIHQVQGLVWDPTPRKFFLDPTVTATVKKSSKSKPKAGKLGVAKDTAPQFYAQWISFITKLDDKATQQMKKRIARANRRNQELAAAFLTDVTDIEGMSASEEDMFAENASGDDFSFSEWCIVI